MKKIELLDIFTDKYGVTADRKKGFHPEVISKYCELGFNQIMHALCLTAIHHSDYSQLDSFIKPYYNVPILCNEQTDEWYSVLPAPIIQLPMNRGVKSISGMKDRLTNFFFRENSTSDVMENLELAFINIVPSYFIENWKIFYDHRMTDEMAQAGVCMKLIVPFSEWDEDDILPLPAGKDLDLIGAIETLINQKAKEDKTPDATPNDFGTEQK